MFDPFSGSGSTIEAAIRSRRKVVAIEINKFYIETSVNRIKRVRQEMDHLKSQPTLAFGEGL